MKIAGTRYSSWVALVALMLLTIWAIVSLFPLYYLFQMAFTPKEEIHSIPPVWVPSHLTLEHFQTIFEGVSWDSVWSGEGGVVRWFINSAFICVIVTGLTLLFSTMAGYGFAKKRFPGRNIMFWMVISTMMIPPQVTLVPVYMMLNSMGLINTLWAVIIPGAASTFGVFMMRQFMKTLSGEFIDAARIDGCSEWGIYWRIVLPLSKPAVATLAIFTFITQWNAYMWPLVVLQQSRLYPLTLGLATLQKQNINQYGLQAAGAAISAIPMLYVFFRFQKYFMKGLTLGGNKG